MVGELAKFKYHPNPLNPDITIHERGYDDSVEATNARILQDLEVGADETVIAEAAIRHESFFIRVDVLVINHQTRNIKLVEVKAKSVKQDDIQANFKERKKWNPYLYDVAFQTVVLEKACQKMLDGILSDYTITPCLLLVDKECACDMDGLNEFVRVIRDNQNHEIDIIVQEGTIADDLGELAFLREVNLGAIVMDLRQQTVPGDHLPEEHAINLETFMQWACMIQQAGQPHYSPLGSHCKKCQFRGKASDQPLLSGVHQCWTHAIEVAETLTTQTPLPLNLDAPLSIDLWGGNAGPISYAQRVTDSGHALLSDVQWEQINQNHTYDPAKRKLKSNDRRVLQINLENDGGDFVMKPDYLMEKMQSWPYPWHMIDFETSAPAIPSTNGMKPYETIAFQFSHHIMHENGQIEHASEFIDIEAGGNPNLSFLRALKEALMPDGSLQGTVFRYHTHENTVLNHIKSQLTAGYYPELSQAEKDELIAFIYSITHNKDEHRTGEHNMVDLYKVVLEGYISKRAGGSNSLKYILPAILQDVPALAEKYAQPGVYGQNLEMHSLNFDEKIWLPEGANCNPYNALPPILDNLPEGFDESSIDELLMSLVDDQGKIDQGGLAMAAYNYSRYHDLPKEDRIALRDSLLKYCELDTLAMCMLVEGFKLALE